jgi:spore maturation protein SpmB
VSTFRIMDEDAGISDRRIAAGFAAILCMSQANATFPLSAFGLNLPVIMATSLAGGLVSAFLTYHVFARHLPDGLEPPAETEIRVEPVHGSLVQTVMTGAEEGFQLVLKAVPMLVLAVLLVNLLKAAGAIHFLERLCGPALAKAGLPAPAVLSIITKYIAGGTAMMGATIPMIQDHTLSAHDLNRIAGFTINTLDPVGLAVLVTAGRRFSAFAVPAVKGALVGILVRGVLHLLIF